MCEFKDYVRLMIKMEYRCIINVHAPEDGKKIDFCII